MKALVAMLAILATPAAAETISAEIGRAGLAATEARLAALPAASAEEAFALGGVRFLRAIESSFQIRWQNGLTDRTGMLPLLRLTLPQLGDLSIRIAHHHGELQIEILATAQGELLLNQGRSDLVDRLQRLYPGERVALDLFGQPDSEQGSRHKRSIYEEWDADA